LFVLCNMLLTIFFECFGCLDYSLLSNWFLIYIPHPTTGYRELRSYLRHTEWQVGISLTFFFHFIYFLDFKFMSDLLHYKWEICIPNMTGQVLIFSKFSINGDRIWHFQQRIIQNINIFSKISKESTSFYHRHEHYSVSSTFLYNGNSKCYVVRILYAISFQWSTCFGYRGQQIILKLTAAVGNREQQLHEFLFLVYPVISWAIIDWKLTKY
jgi:hypothetical protein